MRRLSLIIFILVFSGMVASAQTKTLSEQAAATAMTALWRDSGGYPSKWTYDHGLVLKGIERVYIATNDKQYLDFIQRSLDHFVVGDGSIRTYKIDEYNIDNILPGRNLLFLYKTTGQENYRKAAALLREQLKTHPRTSEGGFWTKRSIHHRCGSTASTWANLFMPSTPRRLKMTLTSTISQNNSS